MSEHKCASHSQREGSWSQLTEDELSCLARLAVSVVFAASRLHGDI